MFQLLLDWISREVYLYKQTQVEVAADAQRPAPTLTRAQTTEQKQTKLYKSVLLLKLISAATNFHSSNIKSNNDTNNNNKIV